jgi:hypothetical protein
VLLLKLASPPQGRAASAAEAGIPAAREGRKGC